MDQYLSGKLFQFVFVINQYKDILLPNSWSIRIAPDATRPAGSAMVLYASIHG